MSNMFANLKKKIESEVGDLSRLTPNLRSITQSEKLTPLSSRHNSVSSLVSETSYNSNKLTSPLGQLDSPLQPQIGNNATPSNSKSDGNSSRSSDNGQQNKLKRIFEEKLQTQELDFAWRLNSKDDEITKLQKQVEHLNNLLQSKEFETQQKLVRVQEDMDSLEGFSQQENAKIKHLLLNREEELGQLRASVMMKESNISEFESQIKSLTVQNERLQKSLDEVVGRQRNVLGQQKADEEVENKLKLKEERITALESEKKQFEMSIQSKDTLIEKLKTDMKILKQEADATADSLRKENSVVFKELKELNSRTAKINQDNEQNSAIITKLQQELLTTKTLVETKEAELSAALLSSRKLQELNGEMALKLASKTDESQKIDEENKKLTLQVSEIQSQFEKLKKEIESNKIATVSEEKSTDDYNNNEKDLIIDNLKAELVASKQETEKAVESLLTDKSLILQELKELNATIQKLSEENEKYNSTIEKLEQDLVKANQLVDSKEIELKTTLLSAKKVQEENQKLTLEMNEKIDKFQRIELENNALVLQISEVQSMRDKLKHSVESGNKLETTIQSKDAYIQKLEAELITLKQQVESTSKNLESSKSLRVAELEELHSKVKVLTNENNQSISQNEKLQKGLITLKAEVDMKDAELKSALSSARKLEKENDALTKTLDERINESQNLESNKSLKDAELEELNSKVKILTNENSQSISENEKLQKGLITLKAEIDTKDAELKSALASARKLEEENDALTKTLDERVNESENVEIENSDLVLQISEIQSKCDELEEENKFLKDSIKPEDSEVWKRKIVELENELLDKNQILKQQSLQLQDLRRSLAKEINKNQAVTEITAVATETSTQCNGSQSLNSSALTIVAAPPPTLPPQETDVNFMYMRSVLFKYLTTTDIQVTQQLTRVVATLLHLSEEESHLLSQSADSRTSHWMSHLITKS